MAARRDDRRDAAEALDWTNTNVYAYVGAKSHQQRQKNAVAPAGLLLDRGL